MYASDIASYTFRKWNKKETLFSIASALWKYPYIGNAKELYAKDVAR